MDEVKRIALLIKDGKTNAQIGVELNYTEHTIKWKLRQFFKKYKAKNRTELVFKILPER